MAQQLLSTLLQEKESTITSIHVCSFPYRNTWKAAIHLKVLLQMLLSRSKHKKIPELISVL